MEALIFKNIILTHQSTASPSSFLHEMSAPQTVQHKSTKICEDKLKREIILSDSCSWSQHGSDWRKGNLKLLLSDCETSTSAFRCKNGKSWDVVTWRENTEMTLSAIKCFRMFIDFYFLPTLTDQLLYLSSYYLYMYCMLMFFVLLIFNYANCPRYSIKYCSHLITVLVRS